MNNKNIDVHAADHEFDEQLRGIMKAGDDAGPHASPMAKVWRRGIVARVLLVLFACGFLAFLVHLALMWDALSSIRR